MRIAIVGAGISGLVAAHRLHPEHDITVYEAGDHVGGHTNTVRVDLADETHWVDTGFIVLNDRNYPNFEPLLAELGVATQPSHMSFSVSDGGGVRVRRHPARAVREARARRRPPFPADDRATWRASTARRAACSSWRPGEGPSLREFLDRRRLLATGSCSD